MGLAGAVVLWAVAAMAAPPGSSNTLAKPVAQPDTRLGGGLSTAPMGGTLSATPIGGTANSTPVGGQMAPGGAGGVLVGGAQGGVLNGQAPVGGAISNKTGGVNSPGSSPGGTLGRKPAGGQLSTVIVGGVISVTNQLNVPSGGVIVGGAQPMTGSGGGALTNTGFGTLH